MLRGALFSAVALMILGVGVLIGWQMGWERLTRLSPQWVTMKPNTALGFLFAGFGLWALLLENAPAWRRRAGRAAGLSMIAFGGIALSQYTTGSDWGIDGWWFAVTQAEASEPSRRMAHATAICFILSGLTLVAPDLGRWGERFAQWGSFTAGVMGLLGVTGYLYGVEDLYSIVSYSSMAIHTALGFLLFAAGVMLGLRFEGGPGRLLTSVGLGGVFMRVLLPVVVLVPLVLGGVILYATEADYFDHAFGFTLFAVGSVLLLSAAICFAARRLERTESARREATAALTANERSSREILEALPQLMWTCTPDGPCDYLSRQWVHYTGVPEGEQLGYGWLERLHPADRERTVAHWKATAGQGLPFSIEFRIRRHDGVYRWFKTLAQPLRGPDGEIVKWFGTNTDIEELKQAEEIQARMAAIVESSADAIIGKTLDGFVTSWNAAAEKLFGYSAQEMLGQSIQRIIPAALYEEERAFLSSVTSGEPIKEKRTVRLRKDQRQVPVVVTIAPVRDATGRVIGASNTSRDITDALKSEGELLRAREDLEQRVLERTAALSEANAALSRNTRQLAEAQHIARMGSWTLNVATGEVEWSEELFHIVGLDPAAEPPNYAVQAGMFVPDSWSRLTAAITHSVESGEGYELELEVVRPDGEHRFAVARASTARDADGRVVRLTGTFQDVTEIKQAREALDAFALRMRLAASTASIGVWEWNVETCVLTWDDTMRRIYDWPGEATFEVWREAVHPDDRLEAEARVSRALDGEADFDHVFRIRTAKGAIRYVHGIASVYRNAQGTALRMIGINHDVTTEHESKLRLRASEELLKEFVRHAPAAIAMLDRDLIYLQTSERWLTDYKLGDRDIIGRCHYDVFPDIPEAWKETHRKVLRGHIDRCDEAPFPRADGGTEWLQWEVRPWHGADGEIGGLIMFTQVITERKRMEIELREQKAELQRSNQELEQFAYVASHDLQEPLRAVTGCTQLLQKRLGTALDSGAAELMRHSVEGAKRMERLIHDLLTYSRVGAGPLKQEPTHLAVPLADALANLKAALAENGGVITHDAELPVVRIERGQIAQLLQNLLGNALKYRAPDRPPAVHVGVAREGDDWKISVSDNGIGIEPRHFERVFVIFQRLHTRAEYSGTGIGLAICKKIVERHGGRIGVESRPGSGSTFHFTLPS